MIDPVELFKKCLEHPEPFFSKEYFNDDPLVSSNHPLLQANKKILELLKEAKDSNEGKENILKKIDKILINTEGINSIPFVNYFLTRDMTFSVYETGKPGQRLDFLDSIIDHYLKSGRHQLAENSGLLLSVQSNEDTLSHKKTDKFSKTKLKGILTSMQYSKANFSENLEGKVFWDFDQSVPMEDLKKHFKLHHYDQWKLQGSKRNKKADYCILNKDILFICECKHQKEGGGGQSQAWGQILDIVDCQKLRCSSDHKKEKYIGFLDGFHFNALINDLERKNTIIDVLGKNKSKNYFVNTWGLEQLIK